MSSAKQDSSENGGSGSDDDGSDEEDDEDNINFTNDDLIFNPESDLRKWLRTRGKDHCIDFEDKELSQLRTYFSSLDDDGSGSIGTDELEEPLIALGLVDSRA